jgi:hypothetical protein
MNDLIENRRKTLKARKRWEEKEGDNWLYSIFSYKCVYPLFHLL